MYLLSILIPTLPEPKNQASLQLLLKEIADQIDAIGYIDYIEVLTDDRDRSVPTGTKRNDLIARATAKRFVFIDDDDHILAGYINCITDAIANADPDVITFEGFITTNGAKRKHWVIRLGESYEERNNVYYRFPNHLAVMKKELVQHVKFPDVHYGEDYAWAKQIHEQGLLKTSVHIEKELYWYDYNPKVKPVEPMTMKERRRRLQGDF